MLRFSSFSGILLNLFSICCGGNFLPLFFIISMLDMTWLNFISFFFLKVYQEFGRRSRRKWFKLAEPTELLRRYVRFKHCTNRLELMKQRKDGRLKRIKENWHEVVFKLIGLKRVTSPLAVYFSPTSLFVPLSFLILSLQTSPCMFYCILLFHPPLRLL